MLHDIYNVDEIVEKYREVQFVVIRGCRFMSESLQVARFRPPGTNGVVTMVRYLQLVLMAVVTIVNHALVEEWLEHDFKHSSDLRLVLICDDASIHGLNLPEI